MHCPCDRAFRVKDELAGKKIRCPACKQVLLVPAPEIEITVEEDAAGYLMAEEPAPRVRKPVKTRDEDEEQEDNDERITSKPAAWPKPAPRREYDEDPSPRRKKRRPRRRDDDDERSGFLPAISISPTIITGLLMMIGAVVWFVLGLVLIDRIFFYPPIMFILGIGAVWRGATGQED